MSRHLAHIAAATLLAGSFLSLPAVAQQSAESFYKGRTITLVLASSPGGGSDVYARIMTRFLTDHIPGHPTIVMQYMPGGGGRKVAGYVNSAAPQDGTVIATVDQSLVLLQALGDTSIPVDTRKLNWIGNPLVDNNVVFTWHASGIKTLDDAKKKEVTLAATNANSSGQAYAAVLNSMIGTKFKIVSGYPAGNEANLAMERGEVAGRAASSWGYVKAAKPNWSGEGKLNVLVQVGPTKSPDLAQVPLLKDLARNDTDRAVLQLLSAPIQIGRPLFTGPAVPADRVALLRKAFDETMHDPHFLQEEKAKHFEIIPVSGQDLQKIVAELVAAPKAAVDQLTALTGVPGH
jgi:tripartite-type tricarboxylate transporter receptor subunit TctC